MIDKQTIKEEIIKLLSGLTAHEITALLYEVKDEVQKLAKLI
jgi:hypothetical protein